ncbi:MULTISPECIES: hypothetical protein [Auritidibacter]|uniref:hypothetical protein n=1 Tax=Auritidibacter TaxID=1160973 RepID=UPI000D730254|nr:MULTISPECIES: hypothetical protein [Auritidibacter]PXA81032.1 hypothetical protein DCC25_04100 [Auritidibacter sp. NML120636]WGH85267.1 hypothetical protein QDX24_06625 [Auritidibacter ignavus]WGH87554.1 hypothetical protein QDX22_06620 [Auritidibacter ignavus]WHS35522.1 hypothetical protein QM403_02890 [Auritidibacter ignavus]
MRALPKRPRHQRAIATATIDRPSRLSAEQQQTYRYLLGLLASLGIEILSGDTATAPQPSSARQMQPRQLQIRLNSGHHRRVSIGPFSWRLPDDTEALLEHLHHDPADPGHPPGARAKHPDQVVLVRTTTAPATPWAGWNLARVTRYGAPTLLVDADPQAACSRALVPRLHHPSRRGWVCWATVQDGLAVGERCFTGLSSRHRDTPLAFLGFEVPDDTDSVVGAMPDQHDVVQVLEATARMGITTVTDVGFDANRATELQSRGATLVTLATTGVSPAGLTPDIVVRFPGPGGVVPRIRHRVLRLLTTSLPSTDPPTIFLPLSWGCRPRNLDITPQRSDRRLYTTLFGHRRWPR